MADYMLDIDVRLGELLAKRPLNIESSGRGTIEKKPSLPIGVTKAVSHQAQTKAVSYPFAG
jgi:hypothetical protein